MRTNKNKVYCIPQSPLNKMLWRLDNTRKIQANFTMDYSSHSLDITSSQMGKELLEIMSKQFQEMVDKDLLDTLVMVARNPIRR